MRDKYCVTVPLCLNRARPKTAVPKAGTKIVTAMSRDRVCDNNNNHAKEKGSDIAPRKMGNLQMFQVQCFNSRQLIAHIVVVGPESRREQWHLVEVCRQATSWRQPVVLWGIRGKDSGIGLMFLESRNVQYSSTSRRP